MQNIESHEFVHAPTSLVDYFLCCISCIRKHTHILIPLAGFGVLSMMLFWCVRIGTAHCLLVLIDLC